jgi:hypothetical protein
MIEKALNRHARADKHRRPAKDFWVSVINHILLHDISLMPFPDVFKHSLDNAYVCARPEKPLKKLMLYSQGCFNIGEKYMRRFVVIMLVLWVAQRSPYAGELSPAITNLCQAVYRAHYSESSGKTERVECLLHGQENTQAVTTVRFSQDLRSKVMTACVGDRKIQVDAFSQKDRDAWSLANDFRILLDLPGFVGKLFTLGNSICVTNEGKSAIEKWDVETLRVQVLPSCPGFGGSATLRFSIDSKTGLLRAYQADLGKEVKERYTVINKYEEHLGVQIPTAWHTKTSKMWVTELQVTEAKKEPPPAHEIQPKRTLSPDPPSTRR